MAIMTQEYREKRIAWLNDHIASMERCRDNIPFGLNADESMELLAYKESLALLTAKPIRYLNKFSGACYSLEQQPNAAQDVGIYERLYTHPEPLSHLSPIEIPDFSLFCRSKVKYLVAKDMIAYAIREAGYKVKRND